METTYKIIGEDGAEYGPIVLEQLFCFVLHFHRVQSEPSMEGIAWLGVLAAARHRFLLSVTPPPE